VFPHLCVAELDVVLDRGLPFEQPIFEVGRRMALALGVRSAARDDQLRPDLLRDEQQRLLKEVTHNVAGGDPLYMRVLHLRQLCPVRLRECRDLAQ